MQHLLPVTPGRFTSNEKDFFFKRISYWNSSMSHIADLLSYHLKMLFDGIVEAQLCQGRQQKKRFTVSAKCFFVHVWACNMLNRSCIFDFRVLHYCVKLRAINSLCFSVAAGNLRAVVLWKVKPSSRSYRAHEGNFKALCLEERWRSEPKRSSAGESLPHDCSFCVQQVK